MNAGAGVSRGRQASGRHSLDVVATVNAAVWFCYRVPDRHVRRPTKQTQPTKKTRAIWASPNQNSDKENQTNANVNQILTIIKKNNESSWRLKFSSAKSVSPLKEKI